MMQEGMTELINIFFNYGIYSLNKENIKKIISDNGLRWNENKVKLELSYEDILDIYKLFKIEDKIINDKTLKDRIGSVGMWNDLNNAVKIIIFSKKYDDEFPPVLLVFKGDETCSFYKTLIKYCVSLGCTISKIVELDGKFEEVFRKRINVELISALDNDEETKKMLINLFDFDISKSYFSDSFVIKWKECIKNWGLQTVNDLKIEIEKSNEMKKNNKIEKLLI